MNLLLLVCEGPSRTQTSGAGMHCAPDRISGRVLVGFLLRRGAVDIALRGTMSGG